MYVSMMRQILFRKDGRTDGRTNKAILGVGCERRMRDDKHSLEAIETLEVKYWLGETADATWIVSQMSHSSRQFLLGLISILLLNIWTKELGKILSKRWAWDWYHLYYTLYVRIYHMNISCEWITYIMNRWCVKANIGGWEDANVWVIAVILPFDHPPPTSHYTPSQHTYITLYIQTFYLNI